MDVRDSRTTWHDYWLARPLAFRLVVSALIAGLVAVYAVMIVLAIFGIWRNNLFRLNTNWPWAVPLAALSLLGRKTRHPFLVHAIAFLPLVGWQGLQLVYFYGSFDRIQWASAWYLPVVLVSIALVNLLAFRWLSSMVEDEGHPAE